MTISGRIIVPMEKGSFNLISKLLGRKEILLLIIHLSLCVSQQSFDAKLKPYRVIILNPDKWSQSSSTNNGKCNNPFNRVNGQLRTCQVDANNECKLISPEFNFSDFNGDNIYFEIQNINIGNGTDVDFVLDWTDTRDPETKKLENKRVNFDLLQTEVETIQISLIFKNYCDALGDIKVQYYECDQDMKDGVVYSATTTPGKSRSSTSVAGLCIENAVYKDEQNKPYLQCNHNKTYSLVGDGCVCDKGFFKNDDSCVACAMGEFKDIKGNQECKPCKKNSDSKDGIHCHCNEGFSRALGKSECFALLEKPKILKDDIQKTHNSVTLSWIDQSSKEGNFVIKCNMCPAPFQTKIQKETSIKITNLRPYTKYEVVIWKQNEETKDALNHSVDRVTFETKFIVPNKIGNPKTNVVADGVRFTWNAPNGTLLNRYSYKVLLDGRVNSTTNNTFFKIPWKERDTTYNVEIIPFYVLPDGNTVEGPPLKFNNVFVKGDKHKEASTEWVIIAGSVVGGLVLIIIILVMIIVYKRRFPSQFEVSRMEDGTMKMEGRYLFSTSRIYTDPTTYSEVDDAVQEFALELNRKHITTDHLLGGGEFANVFKGILSTEDRNSDVAIKVLKPNSSKRDRDDFLSEAAILGQFSDPNVITIEGVVLKDQPNLIVLEYMSNGSLDKYLVKNDSQLSIQKLLGISRGVASGMKYLSELGYIHRDLAARNVLVNNEGVCKIADFGMSRELKTDDTYDTKGGKIPIKWTAPEAIEYKKFTTSSDVWSYGILMWEIFSFGERPYWEWSNLEVMERLMTGYRLPPPMECPKVIHDLMLHCWHKDRTKRPRFNAIFDKVEEWLKKPELLTEIASVITRRDEDLDYSVMEDLPSWLEAIKMEQYLKMFTENGYMTPKDVLYLTNEDLESLGVGILGHRKKLLKAIRNTRLQIEDDRRAGSSPDSPANPKVTRTSSFAGFGNTLTKKVSYLANSSGSISFKKTIGKRSSLGYQPT